MMGMNIEKVKHVCLNVSVVCFFIQLFLALVFMFIPLTSWINAYDAKFLSVMVCVGEFLVVVCLALMLLSKKRDKKEIEDHLII